MSLRPQINELNKSKQRIFVFSDLVLDKKPLIYEYWLRGRKAKCSLFFLSQSYYATNKFIRANTRYFVPLNFSGTRDLNAILRELSTDKSKKEFLEIYECAIGEPLSCLVGPGSISSPHPPSSSPLILPYTSSAPRAHQLD